MAFQPPVLAGIWAAPAARAVMVKPDQPEIMLFRTPAKRSLIRWAWPLPGALAVSAIRTGSFVNLRMLATTGLKM